MDTNDLMCFFEIKENCHVLVNQFHGNFRSKTLGCRKVKSVFRDVNDALMHHEGLKGLNIIYPLFDYTHQLYFSRGPITPYYQVEPD